MAPDVQYQKAMLHVHVHVERLINYATWLCRTLIIPFIIHNLYNSLIINALTLISLFTTCKVTCKCLRSNKHCTPTVHTFCTSIMCRLLYVHIQFVHTTCIINTSELFPTFLQSIATHAWKTSVTSLIEIFCLHSEPEGMFVFWYDRLVVNILYWLWVNIFQRHTCT